MIEEIRGNCFIHWHIIERIKRDDDIWMIYIIRATPPSCKAGYGVCAGINPKLLKRKKGRLVNNYEHNSQRK